MAFLIAKQFSLPLILIISLFSSSHARESQSFSKSTRTNPNINTQTQTYQQKHPLDQYRNFVQEKEENTYGLYGRVTTRDPTTSPPTIPTTVPSPPYRPSNYRTDAYVTSVEEQRTINTNDKTSQESSYTKNAFTNDNNHYTTNSNQKVKSLPYRPTNYNTYAYVTNANEALEKEKEKADEFFYQSHANKNAFSNENYYKTYQDSPLQYEENSGQYSYNPKTTNNQYQHASQQLSQEDLILDNEQLQREQYNKNKANTNNYYVTGKGRPVSKGQGMSDTRFLENGKYYFDLPTQKFNDDHPYNFYGGNSRINGNKLNTNSYQQQNVRSQDEVLP